MDFLGSLLVSRATLQNLLFKLYKLNLNAYFAQDMKSVKFPLCFWKDLL